MYWASLAAAAGLAAVHFFASRLRFLDVIPRSRWLSFGGGVSVAYALVHLLPEVAGFGRHARVATGPPGFMPGHRAGFLLTLAGLVAFYGLERLARESRRRTGGDGASPRAFALHVGSFALYNAVIGHLLLREDRTASELALFAAALACHFVVNDFGLRAHRPRLYLRYGRFVLAAAVLAGWGLALFARVPEAITSGLIGLLAGGVILNTFKEELPEGRQSRFGAFLLGAAGYAGLLLVI